MRARKRLVFFGPEMQLCMQLGFTQSSETECNGAVNSSTARVVGVCARSCMQNTTRVHGGKSAKIMRKYRSFAVECAKISIWLSFVMSYGCTGRGVGGC